MRPRSTSADGARQPLEPRAREPDALGGASGQRIGAAHGQGRRDQQDDHETRAHAAPPAGPIAPARAAALEPGRECTSTRAAHILPAMTQRTMWLGGVVAFLFLHPPELSAQRGAQGGEWPTYGGDLGHTRYAPLDQINAAQLQQARGRLAVQDRQPRSAARVQLPVDAADGQRRALLDRPARAARSSRSTPPPASCSGCTASDEGRARRGGAAAALGPRPRLLDRRQGGADPLRHARLPAGRARREDRAAGRRLRHATASSI